MIGAAAALGRACWCQAWVGWVYFLEKGWGWAAGDGFSGGYVYSSYGSGYCGMGGIGGGYGCDFSHSGYDIGYGMGIGHNTRYSRSSTTATTVVRTAWVVATIAVLDVLVAVAGKARAAATAMGNVT